MLSAPVGESYELGLIERDESCCNLRTHPITEDLDLA
jgi:hypothetical protein